MAEQRDPGNHLVLELPKGKVVIRLRPDLAPKHVAHIKALAREGFYDDTPFHRVIDGFMAQGGDPTGTGTGGSNRPEPRGRVLQDGLRARHRRHGTLAEPEQRQQPVLHLLRARALILDGQYTIWGEVMSGMEDVDKISAAAGSGTVRDPDSVVSTREPADVALTIAADARPQG